MRVQRAYASLVLVLIGLLQIAPAFANSTPTTQLPPCCRAHGKHKCAMRAQAASSPAMYSSCDQFPSHHPASSAALNPSAFLPHFSQLFFTSVAGPRVRQQTEARFRLSYARSRQKRGPPVFLS